MEFGEAYPHLIEAFAIVGIEDNKLPQAVDTTATLQTHLRYKSKVLEFYPESFGESHLFYELPLFCFPDGLHISTTPIEPQCFPFVLTDQMGTRLRCASIIYSTPIENVKSCKSKLYTKLEQSAHELQDIWKISSKAKRKSVQCCRSLSLQIKKEKTVIQRSKSNNVLTAIPDVSCKEDISGWYAMRSICFLSHKPIFEFMLRALKRIYEWINQDEYEAVECFIHRLVGNVPLLPCSNQPITWIMNFDKTESMKLHLPSRQLPLLDFPIRYLLQSLELNKVIRLLFLVLLERRVVITSRNNTLITYVIEAIAALLYPFNYSHTYIPILPRRIIQFIEAPTPYLIGANVAHLKEAVHVDMTGVVYTDLDNNILRIPETEQLPNLPTSCIKSLKAAVWTHLHPELFNLDLLYPKSINWGYHEQQLRLAFVNFFCTFYSTYFGWMTDVDELLQAHPKKLHPFLRNFVETQAFQQLRNYLSKAHLSIDQLITELHEPKTAVCVNTKLTRKGSEISEKDIPQSLVLMLAARALSEHKKDYLQTFQLIKKAWTLDASYISNERALALIHEVLSNMSEQELQKAKSINNEDGNSSEILADAIEFYITPEKPEELHVTTNSNNKRIWKLTAMTKVEFCSFCLQHGIVDAEATGEELFEVLLRGSKRHKKINVGKFKKFISAISCIRKRNEEFACVDDIIFYCTDIWTSNGSKSKLLLTKNEVLVMLKNSVEHYCIACIQDVNSYNHKIKLPPGYPCLKIIMNSKACSTFLFLSRKDRDVFAFYLNELHKTENVTKTSCAVFLTECIRLMDNRLTCQFLPHQQ